MSQVLRNKIVRGFAVLSLLVVLAGPIVTPAPAFADCTTTGNSCTG